jgi:hypothetical protein
MFFVHKLLLIIIILRLLIAFILNVFVIVDVILSKIRRMIELLFVFTQSITWEDLFLLHYTRWLDVLPYYYITFMFYLIFTAISLCG